MAITFKKPVLDEEHIDPKDIRYKYIKISDISVSQDRIRRLDHDWIKGLSVSISDRGLLEPIKVYSTGKNYAVSDGAHRLKAFELLGEQYIDAVIKQYSKDESQARIDEITSHIAKKNWTQLERSHGLSEWKDLYEAEHPESKNGGDRVSKNYCDAKEQNDVTSFCSYISDIIGLSVRRIEISVQIWRNLSSDSRVRLKGTWLEDNQNALKALSDEKKPMQAKILDKLFPDDGDPEVTSVADAILLIQQGQLPDALEKKMRALNSKFKSLPDPEFSYLLLANRTRVLEWARQQNNSVSGD